MPDTIRLREQGFIYSPAEKHFSEQHDLPDVWMPRPTLVLYAPPEDPAAAPLVTQNDPYEITGWPGKCLLAFAAVAVATMVVFAIVGIVAILSGS